MDVRTPHKACYHSRPTSTGVSGLPCFSVRFLGDCSLCILRMRTCAGAPVRVSVLVLTFSGSLWASFFHFSLPLCNSGVTV